MNVRSRAAALVGVIALLVGCSGGSPTASPVSTAAGTPPVATAAPPTSTAPTLDLEHPVGIIAIGHSGLTGEGTAAAGEPNKPASWATGTEPAVHSIYLRMVEVLPATSGQVANTAKGGALSSALIAQATSALLAVPVPALVIVQTIDNDQDCGATTVAKVGENLATAIDLIHTASPNTKILVVGQLGRPTVAFIESLIADSETAKQSVQWGDDCAPVDAEGNVSKTGITNLIASSDAYEAESVRVCALVENCFTDGGVRRAWVDTIDEFGPDFAHFSIAGLAREAEQLWPVVEGILGL